MNRLQRNGRVILAILVALSLLSGAVLMWASHSWYACVWLSARIGFPESGVRVVMVNTEETLARRTAYSLPPDLIHNLALRALIVDRNERVVGTAWREGFLQKFPKLPAGNPLSELDWIHFEVDAWAEAAQVGAWFLIVTGVLEDVALGYLIAGDRNQQRVIWR